MEKNGLKISTEAELSELGDELNVEETVNNKIQASDSCHQTVVSIHPRLQRTDGEKVYFVSREVTVG